MAYKVVSTDDPFMKELNYHEAKVPEMDYMIIYKVVDDTVYLLGIFHTLENNASKMKVLWNRTDLHCRRRD